ncbi:MAG: hypothetical protein Q7U60_08360, partial [Candidatus Methanoperedens sp.]|nr:hypothetical protein [Candidatus Methanoperedens sp.]
MAHVSKSREGEEIGAELLNGDVYDTRNVWYSDIETMIGEQEVMHLNQKIPSKSSFIKMKCLLDKGTELRSKYTGENLDKIPFDYFVEIKNDAYFVEIKTKVKSSNDDFPFSETQ